jgi:hypothetical protein
MLCLLFLRDAAHWPRVRLDDAACEYGGRRISFESSRRLHATSTGWYFVHFRKLPTPEELARLSIQPDLTSLINPFFHHLYLSQVQVNEFRLGAFNISGARSNLRVIGFQFSISRRKIHDVKISHDESKVADSTMEARTDNRWIKCWMERPGILGLLVILDASLPWCLKCDPMSEFWIYQEGFRDISWIGC